MRVSVDRTATVAEQEGECAEGVVVESACSPHV
jgi:hypothetical protein